MKRDPVIFPTDAMVISNQISMILRGGAVKRYHTVRTIATETVAEHSFLVAWCATVLSCGKPSASLLLACLQHDITEAETGDMPSPTKREMGIKEQFSEHEVKVLHRNDHVDASGELTDTERRTLKLADICAGMLFCIQERTMGNKFIAESYTNFRSYADELQLKYAFDNQANDFIFMIDTQWRHVNK